MATPAEMRQKLRQEEEKKRRQQQQSKPSPVPSAQNRPNTRPQSSTNKPKPQNNGSPSIGQRATLNGKPVVWSGQNYGWQSQATHNKLKDQGKFRTGTQALDRATQAVSNAIPKPIKQHFAAVAADQQRQAARQDQQIRQTAGNRVANLVQNDATGKTIEAASKATNVDNRIVGAAANLAQAAVAKKLMPQGGPQLRPQTKPQLQPRSVGAAARPAPTAPTTRRLVTPQQQGVVRPNRNPNPVPPGKTQATQVGKPLGGESKKIAFQNTYHGTSQRDAKSIRENGYRPSATGVYGPGVYTGNKKMAQQYASSAGVRAGDQGAVLRHRVPKKNQQNVPFEKPQQGQRVSPQADLVQQRLRQGKTTRIDYGKGSQVTNLSKAQADRTLVPANGNIRLSKQQQANLQARKQPKSVRLAYDNVAKSEPGYFKPGRGQQRFGVSTEINNAVQDLRNGRSQGFSVPTVSKPGRQGNYVAIDGKVLRNPNPEKIQKFLQQNKDILSRPDAAIGGWKDPKSGKPVIEISRRIPNPKEAERLSKKFQQKATYSSRDGKLTDTGGRDLLRHTKGDQTRGGSRIGGEKVTKNLQQLPNTVKKRVPAPEPKKQPTPLVNRDGSVRQRDGKLRRNIDLPAPRGKDGQRLFTPANRAQAVRRANIRIEGTGFGKEVRNEAIGIDGRAAKTPMRGGTNSSHDIAFGNSTQKLKARGLEPGEYRYDRPSEIGDTPKSKLRQKLIDAGKKDMMGRLMDVPAGDRITAAPTSAARGRLYNASTNGALSGRRGGPVRTTRLPGNRWNNEVSGQEVKFEPRTMGNDLRLMAESHATLVGRRAGGTSYVTAGKPGGRKMTLQEAMANRNLTKQERKRLEQGKVYKDALEERRRYEAEDDFEGDWDDYVEQLSPEQQRRLEEQQAQIRQETLQRFESQSNERLQQLGERLNEAADPRQKARLRDEMYNERFRVHVQYSPYNTAREMPDNVRRSYFEQAQAEVDAAIRRDNNPQTRAALSQNYRNRQNAESLETIEARANAQIHSLNEGLAGASRQQQKAIRNQMIQQRAAVYQAYGQTDQRSIMQQATADVDGYLQTVHGRNR